MKLYKISTLLFLCLSTPSWALSNDTEQPIYIDSDNQELDIQKNIVTFTGNVILRQGSIDIRADKVVITRPNGQDGQETIDAYGKPATFHQIMDDGKPIDGASLKMRYETAIDFLKMTDEAILIQEGSEIQGKVITYKIDEQRLVAESGKKKRVTTILQPKNLNNNKK
ncbi:MULTISPECIES: lipopolysaccharide transport periplasmic protein LptA [Photobacterium]|jgi:lipopolysaccharide export system protein LptA|uniref:Lipopolysaccharide export system protein LptA n=2 Tax=Photobacterium TaxID=657 RepID=A0A2T3JDS0_9GAMM|nr:MULTISPECIES: lipopolysaccharide transport periplasmic protein LptA [Photobacterium]PSU47033.1 lipopolysaccharide transport periplasmic protein LptA [Photobacterium frigidiphilum]PSV43878.1 lipopolysaccharide transport periplasmic protein LptA [Photobacterium indicum]